MVLCVISSHCDIFRTRETVPKKVYLKVLKTKIVPWMIEVVTGRPFVLQQNGAPAHTSNLVPILGKGDVATIVAGPKPL